LIYTDVFTGITIAPWLNGITEVPRRLGIGEPGFDLYPPYLERQMVKIYFYLWLVLAVVFATIFLLGNLTLTTLVVFGFIAFGMTFMGMMGVLPAVVTHETHRSGELDVELISEIVTTETVRDRVTRGGTVQVKAA
jgi:hypothetical protein